MPVEDAGRLGGAGEQVDPVQPGAGDAVEYGVGVVRHGAVCDQRAVDVEARVEVALTPSAPVAASCPELAGDCRATWSRVVSMSNRVVAVAALRSLLVYAAPVTPAAAVLGG